MPAEKGLPVCPKAIATAKPGREHWALEELWDTVVEMDWAGLVQATHYPGVYLVYAGVEPDRLVEGIQRRTHAFLRSFIPACECLRSPSVRDLEEAIRRAVLQVTEGGMAVRLMVRLRGPMKGVYEGVVEDILEGLDLRVHSASGVALAIESVDDVIAIAAGRVLRCGEGCLAIACTG